MDVTNVDNTTQLGIEELMGGERVIIENIADEISMKDWFEGNEYVIVSGPEEILHLFYRNCRDFFKKIEK